MESERERARARKSGSARDRVKISQKSFMIFWLLRKSQLATPNFSIYFERARERAHETKWEFLILFLRNSQKLARY